MHHPPHASLAPRHPIPTGASTKSAPTGLAITADMSRQAPMMGVQNVMRNRALQRSNRVSATRRS